VHLKLPIHLTDELDDRIVSSTGSLDLASGEIYDVAYENYDVKEHGLPATLPDYSFTSGKLSHAGKDVEFSVQVNPVSGRYSVTANELLEIKVRAAKLFAGIDARDLASAAAALGPPRNNVH
jgi:hypothetical protein